MWISSLIITKHNPVSTKNKTVVVFMFTNAVTQSSLNQTLLAYVDTCKAFPFSCPSIY